MRRLILFFLPFYSVSALAFDEGKCGDLFPKLGDSHPPYFSIFYTSTMVPSTTSYLSSWGKCSMYGSRQTLRTQYIATHQPTLELEAARGEGEHVETLARLSGCTDNEQSRFNEKLRLNFKEIFASSQPHQVGERIDQLGLCQKI